MDSIILTFDKDLNVSLQAGDVVFYKDGSDVYQIGECTLINGSSITCDINAETPRPSIGSFIFFAKNSEINISGLTGYYASVKMELSGNAKKELFAVSTEIFQSS